MISSEKYPWEFYEVDSETTDEIKRHFKGLKMVNGFVRIGPKGYLFPKTSDIEDKMKSIFNMPLRPNDIFVNTFPRSGTTLTQELVWLVVNDLDYVTASSKLLVERYTTLGTYVADFQIQSTHIHENRSHNIHSGVQLENFINKVISPVNVLEKTPDQRFIQSHIPLSMMSPNILKIAKVIYVARDPRDVAVSLYHLSKLFSIFNFDGDFKIFWDLFVRGQIVRAPFFAQIKEAWAVRDHPNMLFLFYEEITQNMSAAIQKVSAFLGKQYTDVQIAKLADYLKFENFKRIKTVNMDYLEEIDGLIAGAEPFIRKGKIGGWHDYFDDDMATQAKVWIEENLRDTDLKYPQV